MLLAVRMKAAIEALPFERPSVRATAAVIMATSDRESGDPGLRCGTFAEMSHRQNLKLGLLLRARVTRSI
jgi:hypothetical protein